MTHNFMQASRKLQSIPANSWCKSLNQDTVRIHVFGGRDGRCAADIVDLLIQFCSVPQYRIKKGSDLYSESQTWAFSGQVPENTSYWAEIEAVAA